MIIPPNLYISNLYLLPFYPLAAPTTMPLPDISARILNIKHFGMEEKQV